MNDRIQFDLRPRLEELPTLSTRYSYGSDDDVIAALVDGVRSRGYLTKAELQKVGRWKSPRSVHWMEANAETYVSEITGFALAARDERARVEPLTLLTGVGWPTATVLLHFFHEDRYPILDYRALWTVRSKVPSSCSFEFWWEYVLYARGLAERSALDMRTLDRALWQYSKENQRSG